MFCLFSLCLCTLVSGGKKKLRQTTALKAFVVLACFTHKMLIHHVPHSYAVPDDSIGEASVRGLHVSYEQMPFLKPQLLDQM